MTEENQAARFFNDMAASTEKLVKAMQLIGQTKDEDVTIGTTIAEENQISNAIF